MIKKKKMFPLSMCHSLIMLKKKSVSKLLWYEVNKIFWDVMLYDDNQLWGGNASYHCFHFPITAHPNRFYYSHIVVTYTAINSGMLGENVRDLGKN